MTPRGRLDITFPSLFRGVVFCLAELFGIQLSEIPGEDDENTLPCLSVRTGFDLTLRSLGFEPGSGILMTDINIPDMFSIVAAHQLVIIPLPVNKHTLGISMKHLEASITPGTKAILITHLFGAIMDIDAVVKSAKLRNLIVIEDCAQAFNGVYKGHPQTDVVMFSFGLIKTNTSVTGALLRFDNRELHNEVKMLNDQLPVQHTYIYLKKLLKAIAIQAITLKFFYTLLYNYSRIAGKNIDVLLGSFTRGFPGEDVMSKIRFRQCVANLRLMRMRIHNFSIDRISLRKAVAENIVRMIP
ncbi:MAG: DegT/DnrJ/EryC1/StrS aminotransferase family protein, partial [Pedobacter sp.]